MRRVKKDFNFTTVTITNLETKDVVSEYKVDGKTTKEAVAKTFFKDNKFLPIDISLKEEKRSFFQSGEDFMLHGTEIIEPKTGDSEAPETTEIK